MRQRPESSFTLVELMTVIAITAALIVGALFFVAGYVTWGRNTSDHQTYTVLNDALTRYKCEGGNLNALTLGAPMGDIFTALQTPVSWTNLKGGHQFLNSGYTYPGRSLQATGTGAQYQFYQVGSYMGMTPSAGTPTTQYQYGQGVGYVTTGGPYAGNGIIISVTSTSGHFAVKAGGAPVISASGSWPVVPGTSGTFWACAADGTPSGVITKVDIDEIEDGPGLDYGDDFGYAGNSVASLDVSGLTGLTTLNCQSSFYISSINAPGLTGLTSFTFNNGAASSINLSGCTGLTSVDVSTIGLNTLSLSGCPAMTSLNCGQNGLTSLDVHGLTHLTTLICATTNITSLNASHCPALTTINCSNGSISTLDASYCPALTSLDCDSNYFGTINITGDHALGGGLNDSGNSPNQTTITVTGP